MTAGKRDLCIMACVFCKEPAFQAWVHTQMSGCRNDGCKGSEAEAKAFILKTCDVKSRNDLDRDPAAAERFHELVRKPYLAWKNPEHGDDTFYSGMDVGTT